MRTLLLITTFVIAFAFANLSCRSGNQSPPPKQITAADLAKLRWIEGSWRGTGDIDKPFYERYHFENETTLVSETLADDSFSKVNEVTRFELKDGVFGNGGAGSRWAASEIDDNSINFEPVAKASNSFRFQRESKDSWKAVLTTPANGNTPTKTITYLMERWPAKASEAKPTIKPVSLEF